MLAMIANPRDSHSPWLGDFEKCGKFPKFFKPFLKLIIPKENYS